MGSLPFDLVAVDLDGTLADEHNRCSPVDLRAMRAVAQLGASVVIASGRMHAATERFWHEAGLNAPILSYNGAMIKHPRDGLVWFHLTVPAPFADEVVDFCESYGYHLNYYLNDHLYVKEETSWSRLYHQRTGSVVEPVGSLRRFRGQSPTKLILIDTPETTDYLRERFQERFGERLNIIKSNDEYLEFMHPGANKARTLQRLAYLLGVPQERVLAIGDGNNDIPMMRWAGYAVAMGNAKPAVKELAHQIAPPIEQNGLAVALVEIFGLNREEVFVS
ncbi:MAG: Cof-type HAD-IIB family hydrolase [Armatimonadetes bacterium]|nr:Cof-type HAD-IIB family hydrolase [Armatimonadota bacterium]